MFRHSMYKHHQLRCSLLERRRHVQRRGPSSPSVAHVYHGRKARRLRHLDQPVRDALMESPNNIPEHHSRRRFNGVPLREIRDVRQIT